MANNDNKLISLRGLEEFRKLSQWTLSKNGTKVVLTGPKGETSSADVGDVNLDKINANTDAIEDITDRVEELENSSITSEDIAGLAPAFTESSTLTNISSGDSFSTLFGKIRKAITDFMAHITNFANPHQVTKSQVGLGNVDNTSDADKPISTATQEALNGKVSKLKAETLVYDLTAPNFIGHLTGAADRLANARTISLSGDASGSASFDGSQNIDITTTVVDASGVTAGKMYLYQGLGQNTNGTITQKLFTDLSTAVDDVQTSADGKSTIYYKTTAPVASDDVVLKENDLWFDTDDGNKPYRWNGTAWVEAPFGDAAIANLDAGKITAGYISASRIAANTIASTHIATGAISADKIDTGAVTADKIGAGAVTANKIDAGAVTADKISVDDLSALNATIGGFSISDSAIYSANKTSFSDSDSGVYFGSNGTINIGDSSQYIKFSNDGLQIRADSLSVSGSSVATTADLDDAVKTVVVEYVSSDSPVTPPATGWSATNPNWEEGKYVWQRTITTYINDTSVISDPICIQGARGLGVVSQIPHYLASEKSEGVTSADSGWSKTAPTLTNEKKYLWVYYTNMLSSQVEPEVVTETGNPVEFESRGNNPVTGSTHLPPIQDNDYGYAWAGGEGKNLLRSTCTDATVSGVTFTVSSDGSITAKGTSTDRIDYLVGRLDAGIIQSGVSYCISGSTGGSGSTWSLWVRGHGTVDSQMSRDGDGEFIGVSADTNGRDVTLTIFSNVTIDATFYPMVRLDTETDAYEPYENICPINNYDNVEITQAGESVLGDVTISSGYYNDSGNNASNASMRRCDDYISCSRGSSYAVLFTYGDTDYAARVRVHEYDADKKWLRQIIKTEPFDISTGINIATWVASSDASYFRFSLPIYETVDVRRDVINYPIALPMATYCSDVTLYDNGSVTLSSHGDTETFDGTNVETSSVSGVFKLPLSHVPETVGFRDEPYDLYCDKLKPVSRYELHNGAHGIAYDGEGNYLQFRAGEATTLAEAKAWLTANPVTVVYRKAVPTTTSLPSMDISTFTGKNMFYTHDNVRAEMRVSYKDCETTTTEAYITGVYGDKGVDGVTPVIEASKNNGVTVITSNGVSIAQINDGVDGENGSSYVDQIAYYLASDKPTGVTVNDSGWSREIPELSNEKKYLWVYYTNRFNSSGTEPELITETGDVISTESLGENPVKLSIDIEPHQDLNGYDHAWVGGAGKNLLPSEFISATTNGITFTENANGSVKASGTATAVATRTVNFVLKAGDYVLSGCPSDGSSTTYEVQIEIGGTYYRDYGSGRAFTLTEDANVRCILVVRKDQTVNITYYPMIRLASETDATYEPYANICPISGYTGVTVARAGKNLIDPAGLARENVFTVNSDGSCTFTKTAQSSSGRITNICDCRVKAGQMVTFSADITGTPTSGNPIHFDLTATTTGSVRGSVICTVSGGKIIGSCAPIEDTIGARLYWQNNSTGIGDSVVLRNIQVEYGETATEYAGAAEVDTYTITFPTAAGTVYGGTLTVNNDGSGTLTVDRAGATFNGSESWSVMNTGYRTPVSVRGVAYSLDAKANWLKSASVDPTSSEHLIPGAFIVGAWCTMNVQNIQSITDVATLKTYLAENPLTIVYPIVQPKTYTLTNTQVIKLLKGKNNVWADVDGEIAVSYSNCETTNTKAYVTGVYGDKGNTPVITSSKSNGVTIIKSDGLSVAEINDGERGTSIIKITTAPESYTTTTGGFTPTYRVAISAVHNAGVAEALVGDILENSYYHYPVGYVDDDYVYLGARVSIRGATGSRGATWYAGTAITGTSTTATIFSGSGISSAIVGDHYLNTDTQNVYVCKKAGAASVATWAFEQNIKGENGTPGTKGADGKTAYFHVKYSDDGGATFTANSGETAGAYIGTYTDNTSADSTSVSAYTWVKIEGTDGVSPTLTTSKTNGVTTITITDASGTKTATVNDGTAGARGATWYAGTAITGTSTTAAVFSGSGITAAIVGDHYLNTSTQNVYVCKKAGNASTATWAYEQNIKGATGTPGTNGTNGKTAYFHVKYSNDGGATFTANSGETAGSYIGTYTDNTEADSTSVSAYTWVKIEGEDGERGATWYAGTTITGTDTTAKVFSGSGITAAIVGDHYLNTSTQNVYICKKAGNASTATWAYEQNIKGEQGTPGTNGTNGQTAYFHVKYSNDGGTTFTGNSGEDAGAYIGTYTDNTAADSTSVSAYTWIKIEGTDGKNGTNAIGLAWRVNSASYTDTGNNGECYFHGYNSDNEPADVDGWVMWNGEKLTITKGMWINHNGKVATYTPILHVYRTNVEPCHADVWWDKNLKRWRGFMYTTGNVPGTVDDWTWDETNDAILATYLLNGTAAEASISSAQLFNPPKKYSELPDYENLVVVEDLGVNLSPYFARSPYTRDNPYWHYIYSDNSSLYQIEEVGEGWMHVYCNNTTSSTVRHDFGPVASNEIEEGADYTFLVEVRKNHSSGTASGTDIYLVQRSDFQFWGGSIKENIEGDGATGSSFSPITHVPLDSSTPYVKRFVKVSESTGSTHWTGDKPSGLATFTTRCAKNTTIDYEIRISVYKGRYTGPFRPYVDASVRNLTDNANSKIDNLQVGGRNLLLGSNDTSKWGRYTPDQYQIANINTSIALVAGQEYTLTIWGTQPTRSDKTETCYGAYYGGGSIKLGEISIDDNKGYGSLTFTMPEYSTTNHYIALFNTPTSGASGTTYGASIERVKLEMGNHATDWTAAPEDFESGIATAQTAATNAQTAAGNAQTTADTAKDLAESVQPELIVGTHGTSATATWTGTSTVLKEIKAGTRIQYKLSSAGKSNVTLNLTLVGGTTTGAKAVYYNNTTRLGTQYGVNAVIDLVYDGSYWRILNPYTNSNNYDRILYSQAVKAATAYVGTHILCGTSAGYSNIGANVQFELSYPLLWYATAASTTIDAGETANNHYLTYPNINFSANGTIQSGGAYKQLYLKGTMTGGKFKIAASNYLTTVEPTSADGFYYIPLGVMSSATNGRFVSTDKLYAYLNGAFQCVEYASKELADEAAKTATNFMYFDETNGLIISQEGEINAQHPVTSLQDGNVRIDSDSVDIYYGQNKVASYGEKAVIGNTSRVEISDYGMSVYPSNKNYPLFDIMVEEETNTYERVFDHCPLTDDYTLDVGYVTNITSYKVLVDRFYLLKADGSEWTIITEDEYDSSYHHDVYHELSNNGAFPTYTYKNKVYFDITQYATQRSVIYGRYTSVCYVISHSDIENVLINNNLKTSNDLAYLIRIGVVFSAHRAEPSIFTGGSMEDMIGSSADINNGYLFAFGEGVHPQSIASSQWYYPHDLSQTSRAYRSQFIVGRYNNHVVTNTKTYDTDHIDWPLFIVGNGQSSLDENDALVCGNNGNLKIDGILYTRDSYSNQIGGLTNTSVTMPLQANGLYILYSHEYKTTGQYVAATIHYIIAPTSQRYIYDLPVIVQISSNGSRTGSVSAVWGDRTSLIKKTSIRHYDSYPSTDKIPCIQITVRGGSSGDYLDYLLRRIY